MDCCFIAATQMVNIPAQCGSCDGSRRRGGRGRSRRRCWFRFQPTGGSRNGPSEKDSKAMVSQSCIYFSMTLFFCIITFYSILVDFMVLSANPQKPQIFVLCQVFLLQQTNFEVCHAFSFLASLLQFAIFSMGSVHCAGF